jgi:N-sulfoglucosamine sulfohydrolase
MRPAFRLLALLLLPVPAFASAAASRPNLLWITAEDLSPTLGCYGDPVARTPHLDAFARQAVRYDRAFAVAPVCAPSRATLITGVHANSQGNPHLRSEITLPADFHGYPHYLRQAGYFATNQVKTDYNLRDEAAVVRRWWNRSDPQAHWRQRAPGQPFLAVINIMDTHQSRSSVYPEEQFEREIGAHLPRAQRADPARVVVPPFYPDTPATRKALARYYDCVASLDRKVGAILRDLEADGLAGETIVFFYGDHGMGMPRGKRLLHDSGMRVPLLVRFPPKWAHLAPATPGSAIDRLVNFVDFAPTLLSLAGVPLPRHFQGTAFLGAAAGPARRYVPGARDRVDEVFDTSRSVRDERWLYIRNYRPHLSWAPPEGYSDQSAFRRDLLARAHRGELGAGPSAWLAASRPREELYDTQADPHQVVNLAADPAHAATLARLRGALRAWLEEIRDVAFVPEEQMFTRAAGRPPYEVLRAPGGAEVFARILAAAETVGDAGAAPQQRAWLAAADPTVRYWAAVGLTANPVGARDSRAELQRALRDVSPSVQLEAAAALLGAGHATEALPRLEAALRDPDLNLALHAARALELAGEPARPALPAVRARLAETRTREGRTSHELYLRFSLGALVDRLEAPTGPR